MELLDEAEAEAPAGHSAEGVLPPLPPFARPSVTFADAAADSSAAAPASSPSARATRFGRDIGGRPARVPDPRERPSSPRLRDATGGERGDSAAHERYGAAETTADGRPRSYRAAAAAAALVAKTAEATSHSSERLPPPPSSLPPRAGAAARRSATVGPTVGRGSSLREPSPSSKGRRCSAGSSVAASSRPTTAGEEDSIATSNVSWRDEWAPGSRPVAVKVRVPTTLPLPPAPAIPSLPPKLKSSGGAMPCSPPGNLSVAKSTAVAGHDNLSFTDVAASHVAMAPSARRRTSRSCSRLDDSDAAWSRIGNIGSACLSKSADALPKGVDCKPMPHTPAADSTHGDSVPCPAGGPALGDPFSDRAEQRSPPRGCKQDVGNHFSDWALSMSDAVEMM